MFWFVQFSFAEVSELIFGRRASELTSAADTSMDVAKPSDNNSGGYGKSDYA